MLIIKRTVNSVFVTLVPSELLIIQRAGDGQSIMLIRLSMANILSGLMQKGRGNTLDVPSPSRVSSPPNRIHNSNCTTFPLPTPPHAFSHQPLIMHGYAVLMSSNRSETISIKCIGRQVRYSLGYTITMYIQYIA